MGPASTMRRAAVLLGAITMFLVLGASPWPATAQVGPPANVDRGTSDALSKYFHKNRLPMVGAQVSTTADGKRHVMLYGYTATDFGKRDAEQKARDFLHDPSVLVANRIQVNPRLRKSGRGKAPPPEYDQSAQEPPGEGAPPATADWERQVDDTLRAGGASPSNDPNLKMPAPGGPAPAPPGEHW
jgi:hypothetical protein